MKCLAYYLDKLKSTPDGDGTLLDHSLVLYGTNMGDSNQHLHYDVPHILVGGASGQLKGGRHLAFPTKTVTTGNLLLSILACTGSIRTAIGDSTGPLTGLAYDPPTVGQGFGPAAGLPASAAGSGLRLAFSLVVLAAVQPSPVADAAEKGDMAAVRTR